MLVISSVDAIQKLHVRSVPLLAHPRRITSQSETSSVGILVIEYQKVIDYTGNSEKSLLIFILIISIL